MTHSVVRRFVRRVRGVAHSRCVGGEEPTEPVPRPRIAFVGSGGATKGVAHLGALKALEEFGLVPDVFVGASAGAIAGAFASQGVRADEMVSWFRPFWHPERGRDPLKGRHFVGLPTWEQLTRPGYLASGLLSIGGFEKFLRRRLPQ